MYILKIPIFGQKKLEVRSAGQWWMNNPIHNGEQTSNISAKGLEFYITGTHRDKDKMELINCQRSET
jgi:hypothetical protein